MRCYHPANMCNLASRRDNSKITVQSGPSSPMFSGVRRVSRKPSTGQTPAHAPPLVRRTRNIDQIQYRRRAGLHTPIQFLTSKAKIARCNGTISQCPSPVCHRGVIARLGIPTLISEFRYKTRNSDITSELARVRHSSRAHPTSRTPDAYS